MTIFVIFVCEGLEFGLGKSEVEHGEHCAELRHGDLALAELVEISEKLFDSDSLHDHFCLKALFDVGGIVCDVHGSLEIAVFQHVDFSGRARVEEVAGRDCGGGGVCGAGLGGGFRFLGSLGTLSTRQLREHIFRAIHICDEREIVDFSLIILVEILSDYKVIDLI